MVSKQIDHSLADCEQYRWNSMLLPNDGNLEVIKRLNEEECKVLDTEYVTLYNQRLKVEEQIIFFKTFLCFLFGLGITSKCMNILFSIFKYRLKGQRSVLEILEKEFISLRSSKRFINLIQNQQHQLYRWIMTYQKFINFFDFVEGISLISFTFIGLLTFFWYKPNLIHDPSIIEARKLRLMNKKSMLELAYRDEKSQDTLVHVTKAKNFINLKLKKQL